MSFDRNKSELTHRVTNASYRYLDERGCKPLETEVCVGDGWIADLAGALTPTNTELIDLKLIPRKPKYTQVDSYRRWIEVVNTLPPVMTVLAEVKTSKSDFCGDRKWALSSPANLSYLAIPCGMKISAEQLPPGWGVLEYSSAADYVRLATTPTIKDVSIEQQRNVILNIAIRRDHQTRYERVKQFRRRLLIENNEHLSATRMSKAMLAAQAIIAGKFESAKNCLEYYGVRNLPQHQIEECEKMFGILCPRSTSDGGHGTRQQGDQGEET